MPDGSVDHDARGIDAEVEQLLAEAVSLGYARQRAEAHTVEGATARPDWVDVDLCWGDPSEACE